VFEPKWRVLRQRAPIVKRIALPAVLMIRCDYKPTTGFAAVQGDRSRSWERVVAEPSRTGVSLRAVIRGKWCVSKFDFCGPRANGVCPNSGPNSGPNFISPSGACPNLVEPKSCVSKFGSVQIWFMSKFGSPKFGFQIWFNLVCVQIWFPDLVGVCPDLVGVCPDLVGVQIWLLWGRWRSCCAELRFQGIGWAPTFF